MAPRPVSYCNAAIPAGEICAGVVGAAVARDVVSREFVFVFDVGGRAAEGAGEQVKTECGGALRAFMRDSIRDRIAGRLAVVTHGASPCARSCPLLLAMASARAQLRLCRAGRSGRRRHN